jgi:hypothetical protein
MCDRLKQVMLTGSTRLTTLCNGFISIQENIVKQGEDVPEGAVRAGRSALVNKMYQTHQAVSSLRYLRVLA